MIGQRKIVSIQIKSLLYRRHIILSRNSAVNNSYWLKAKNDAENVVGYSISDFNLRHLLNQEVTNVALYLQKHLGEDSPMVKNAK